MKSTEQKYYLGLRCNVIAELPNNNVVIEVYGETQIAAGSNFDPPEWEQTCDTLIVPANTLSASASPVSAAEKRMQERNDEIIKKHKEEIFALREERDRIKLETVKLNEYVSKNANRIHGIQDFLDLATENFTHVLIIALYTGAKIVEKGNFTEKDSAYGNAVIKGRQYTYNRKEEFICIVSSDGVSDVLVPCSSYQDAILRLTKVIEETHESHRFVDTYVKYKKDLPYSIEKYETAIKESQQKMIDNLKKEQSDLLSKFHLIDNQLADLRNKKETV